MNITKIPDRLPKDLRASVAIDLGAESCRVSLLRWHNGTPELTLVHRISNGPRVNDGLRWPLQDIETAIDHSMRRCAAFAPEGIRSVAVDGWAVDYVRLENGMPLGAPFCYRDDRTLAAEEMLHKKISAQRLQEITGIELSRINTLYQLFADNLMELPTGDRWLNLPEYMLYRWGGEAVGEYTNASHSQMMDLQTGSWSTEIFEAAGLDLRKAPPLVHAGTRVGKLSGPLAQLPAFRDTDLIATACHDTAAAVAGIPFHSRDWAYLSSGTWSLIGMLLRTPCDSPAALQEGFTNLRATGGQICFHQTLNGMWLLKQCMDAWSMDGTKLDVAELVAAAERIPPPDAMIDISDPELLGVGKMPHRLNQQRRLRGLQPLNESASNSPAMASLIFHSLASAYAKALERLEHHTGHRLKKLVVVGGGSRNEFLSRLTEKYSGKPVVRGSSESSTIGNLAVQLAALESDLPLSGESFADEVSSWAEVLLASGPIDAHPNEMAMDVSEMEDPRCIDATC